MALRIIPISALNHYAYCPRRCALIHQEHSFEENRFTLEGQDLHAIVDEPSMHAKPFRVETSVRLWSRKFGLTGIADVVEWHDDIPYPVEFKRGKRHPWINDDIQLCAQALCLEEMLDLAVPLGAIFHGASQHRREVELTEDVRRATEQTIVQVRDLIDSRDIPEPTSHLERCQGCSLVDVCLPNLYGKPNPKWDLL
jgi:CRISPR-associated exonuclease Cas4